jgi:hypothetical protein
MADSHRIMGTSPIVRYERLATPTEVGSLIRELDGSAAARLLLGASMNGDCGLIEVEEVE